MGNKDVEKSNTLVTNIGKSLEGRSSKELYRRLAVT